MEMLIPFREPPTLRQLYRFGHMDMIRTSLWKTPRKMELGLPTLASLGSILLKKQAGARRLLLMGTQRLWIGTFLPPLHLLLSRLLKNGSWVSFFCQRH